MRAEKVSCTLSCMDIIPLGLSSFKLKGKTASVVCDPYDQAMVGLKFPKHTTAHIVTISHDHPDHNNAAVVEPEEGSVVVFKGPGEYEARGVEITGVPTYHDEKNGAERGRNTLYRIDIDGISILHCGDLGHKLTEEQEEALPNIDVLLIPVGGLYSLDARTANEVVTQLEPNIVIPMHYHVSGLNAKVFGGLAPVSQFLKEIGQETVAPTSKFKVTKDSLPAETQVVVLE